MAKLTVRLTPRASRNSVDAYNDGVLHARVTAAPANNAANDAVIRMLAKTLRVPASTITISRGATARSKTLEVASLTAEQLAVRLEALTAQS